MARRIRKILVIGVGAPPPLPLRPLALEIPRIWEAKQQASERQPDQVIQEGRDGPGKRLRPRSP
jgi:hypothetical protein